MHNQTVQPSSNIRHRHVIFTCLHYFFVIGLMTGHIDKNNCKMILKVEVNDQIVVKVNLFIQPHEYLIIPNHMSYFPYQGALYMNCIWNFTFMVLMSWSCWTSLDQKIRYFSFICDVLITEPLNNNYISLLTSFDVINHTFKYIYIYSFQIDTQISSNSEDSIDYKY